MHEWPLLGVRIFVCLHACEYRVMVVLEDCWVVFYHLPLWVKINNNLPEICAKIRLCLSYQLYRRCESCVGGCAPAAGVSLWDWLQPSASLWSHEETPKTTKKNKNIRSTNFVIKYLQVSFSEKHWCPHVISSHTQYNTWNIYTRHTPPSVEPVMQSAS